MQALKIGDKCLILPGVIKPLVGKTCTLLQHFAGPFAVNTLQGARSIRDVWHVCTEDGISTLQGKSMLIPAKFLIKLPGEQEKDFFAKEESLMKRLDELTRLEKSRKMQAELKAKGANK